MAKKESLSRFSNWRTSWVEVERLVWSSIKIAYQQILDISQKIWWNKVKKELFSTLSESSYTESDVHQSFSLNQSSTEA